MNNPAEIWEDIYAAGRQFNKAPFDEVVSFVFLHRPQKPPHETKIMEVGCGVGNNLKFFAREGFSCYGVDGSARAIEEANEGAGRLPNYEVQQGDFRRLPWPENYFDMVIDRAALWYVDRPDARKSIYGIHRVLKKGGKFLFTPCRWNSDERTGDIRFDTGKQAKTLLPDDLWKIHSFDRVDVWDIRGGYKIRSSQFRIVAEKK